MFRCTECQLEYEKKPDFCDCGNDVFEEIKEEPKEEPKPRKTFEEQYPFLIRFKESLDPISVGIFTICIILSILSLIFIGNSDEGVKIVEEIKDAVQTNVKDIDEIWDDTPVKIVQEKRSEDKKTVENVAIKVITPPIQTQNAKKPVQKNVNQKVNTNKQVAGKTTSSVKTSNQKNVPSTKTTAQKSTPSTKTTAQKTTTAQTKPQTQTNTSNNTSTTQQLKPTIPTKTEKTTNVAHLSSNDLRELKIYKNSLRNLLFSKIDFAQIQGDGIGIVAFKIESNGRLTNKSFVQRSNNEQLDDAIFYSLNTTSSYKAPPSSYNGEILKFKVKFVGGQYEVSLN